MMPIFSYLVKGEKKLGGNPCVVFMSVFNKVYNNKNIL